MSVPLKCIELVPYTVDFADGNDRKGPFPRLHDTFVLPK